MEDGDWGVGDKGGALTFDGIDEDILINHASALDFDWDEPFSISFRIKTTGTGTQSIMSKITNTTAYTGIQIYVGSGAIVFQLNNDAAAASYMGAYPANYLTSPINDGVWHSVTIVYNGNGLAVGIRIYVDGVNEPTTSLSDTLGAPTTIKNSDLTRIGSDNSLGNYYSGSLDDVRIYNQVLSATQALAIHDKSEPQIYTATVESLHMYLDESSGTLAEDASSNNYDAVAGDMAWAAAKVGNGGVFDGTLSYLDYGNIFNFEYTMPWSLAFWYKSNGGVNDTILIKMRSAGDYRGFRVKINASGIIQSQLIGTTGALQVVGSTNVRDTAWHYITVTYDGSGSGSASTVMTVDNVGETEAAITDTLGGTIIDKTERLFTGVYEGIGERLKGTVDDFRFYKNKVLTAGEKTTLYNSGNGTQAPL